MASRRGRGRRGQAARAQRLMSAWRPAASAPGSGAALATDPRHLSQPPRYIAARVGRQGGRPVGHQAEMPASERGLPPHTLPSMARNPLMPQAMPRRRAGSSSTPHPDIRPSSRRTVGSVANALLAIAARAGAAGQAATRATLWMSRPLRVPRSITRERSAAPALAWLLTIGALIELCLFGLVVITPLGGTSQSVSPLARAWAWVFAPARFLFPGWNFHIGTMPDQGEPAWPAIVFAVLLILATVALGAALLRSLWEHGSSRRHLVLVLGVTLALGATLVLLPTLPSDDVFSYIIYGRIAALHHANPLVAVPASFPDDPFRTFVYWRNVRSVYGPIWLMASSGITMLAEALGGSLAVYVLLFKSLGLLCHLLNILLIWGILSIIAPRRRLMGTLLYGWNPLCLLEFCASGHNDALMLTFLLAGVYFLVRRWEVPALLAFGLSIATKYVPLALLPFYLFYVARQVMLALRDNRLAGDHAKVSTIAARSIWTDRRLLVAGARTVAWRLIIVLGVVVIATLPYWAGPGTLKSVLYSPPAERLDNSLLEALAIQLEAVLQTPFGVYPSISVIVVEAALKVAAVLGFVALWLAQFRRAKSLPGALEAWAWVLLWYVLVASGWFWPWYVTWVIAIVALLPWSKLSMTTLLLSGGVLLLYAFRPLAGTGIYTWRACFEFGPAAIYLFWVTLARRRIAQERIGGAWGGLAPLVAFARRVVDRDHDQAPVIKAALEPLAERESAASSR